MEGALGLKPKALVLLDEQALSYWAVSSALGTTIFEKLKETGVSARWLSW